VIVDCVFLRGDGGWEGKMGVKGAKRESVVRFELFFFLVYICICRSSPVGLVFSALFLSLPWCNGEAATDGEWGEEAMGEGIDALFLYHLSDFSTTA
jgi:hypothetical protein